MPEWVMIIFIFYSGNSVAVEEIGFTSRQACNETKAIVEKEVDRWNTNQFVICTLR